MTMKIKISYPVVALIVLLLGSPVQAQHNHVLQSSISGQYDRLIRKDNRGAGIADQAIEKRKPQPKPNKNVGSSAGPIAPTKNSN